MYYQIGRAMAGGCSLRQLEMGCGESRVLQDRDLTCRQVNSVIMGTLTTIKHFPNDYKLFYLTDYIFKSNKHHFYSL